MTKTSTSKDVTSLIASNILEFNHCFQRVLARVTATIHRKFDLNHHTAEEVASTGMVYASHVFLDGPHPAPFTEEVLTRLAIWKASNAAKDWLRHERLRPDTLLLGDIVSNEDGEVIPESPLLSQYAFRVAREQAADRRWQALGDFAYRHLEKMFDLLNLNPLHRAVYRAIDLEKRPVDETCARYNITRVYAYVIVHKVKQGLRRVGPDYLRAA